MQGSDRPKNDKFYLQATDGAKEGFHGEPVMGFEWNITYSCNFRCPHCIFDGKWDEYGKRTVFLKPEEWVRNWEKLFKLYGRSSVIVTGGEPFTYPGFIEIIKGISEWHYPINISTNGSGDLPGFIKAIDPGKVALNLSFQPGFNELESIIAKVKLLKNSGFGAGLINLCAYPPYLKKLDEYVRISNALGEQLKVIPFYGRYNNADYPDAYSETERRMLGLGSAWENNVRRKGIMCKAGYRSALIFPDGKVARCGQIGERDLLGNILSDDFKLLAGPKVCDAELCPCLEGEEADK